MLGTRIRELREVRHLSQVELAEVMHVSKQSISNWENGNILPSVEMVVRLAVFFSVSTDYLLGLDDRVYLEVSGLTKEKIAHLQLLINDIRA